jgi:hypothetical protein
MTDQRDENIHSFVAMYMEYCNALHIFALRPSTSSQQNLNIFSVLIPTQINMNSSKGLYQPVPAIDAPSDDRQFEPSFVVARSSRAYHRLWYYVLIVVVVGQSIAIILLGKAVANSCHSIRTLFHFFLAHI